MRTADCSLEWSSPAHTRSSTLALELHDSNTLIHNKAWFTYNREFGGGGGSGLRCDTHVILPRVTTREFSYACKLS